MSVKFWNVTILKLFKKLKDVSKLDEKEIESNIKQMNVQIRPMKDILYTDYEKQLKDSLGERPYQGKWNNSYVELDEDNNLLIDFSKKIYLNGTIFNFLKVTDIFADEDFKKLLDNNHFIEFFSNLITIGLYSLGQNLMNMGGIAEEIVKIINEKTGRKYALLNCKDGISSYTCGRAVSNNLRPATGENTPRIIIFNTVSSYDDNIDFERYAAIFPEDNEPNYTLGGDKHYYWKKYMKYKQKYMSLKKLYKDFI